MGLHGIVLLLRVNHILLELHDMRILAIDPGTTNTGIAIIDIDANLQLHLIFAETIDAILLSQQYKDIAYLYGIRQAKIHAIATQIKYICTLYTPDVVISEAPFYSPTRPNAFAALVETITTIRCYVRQVFPYIDFSTIDPSTVKKNMGVSGISGDKSLMLKAVKLQRLSYENSVNLDSLDEHAIDAISVGLYKCGEILSLE